MNRWKFVSSIQSSDSDFVLESFSDDESARDQKPLTNGIDVASEDDVLKQQQQQKEEEGHQSDDRKSDTSELRKLRRRKVELERSNKMQEKRHERYQVSNNNSNLKCREMFQVPIKWMDMARGKCLSRINGDCHKTAENWTAKNDIRQRHDGLSLTFDLIPRRRVGRCYGTFCLAFCGHSVGLSVLCR